MADPRVIEIKGLEIVEEQCITIVAEPSLEKVIMQCEEWFGRIPEYVYRRVNQFAKFTSYYIPIEGKELLNVIERHDHL